MKFIKILYYIIIISFLNSQNWTIKIITEINLWGMDNFASDEENYLGVDVSALDEYDNLDIPEPPHIPSNYITFYFPHPEWGSNFSSNFTQDIRNNDSSIYTNNGKTWIGNVYSDASGETMIMIEPGENVPNCNYNVFIDNIEYNNELIINFDLDAYNIKEIEIKVYGCEELKKENIFFLETKEIEIYPNPFNGNSKIKYYLNEAGITTINIINILGKNIDLEQSRTLLSSSGENYYNINSQNMKSGIYFIQIETKNRRETKKFIIIK